MEPGRPDPARDRAEGRHRLAAPDGALLRAARERRQARDALPRLRGRAARQRRLAADHRGDVPPAPPEPVDVDPEGLAVVRDGLYLATHDANGTSSGVFGSFPVPIAGKTGTAEKVVDLPGYGAGHLEDQSWWCGWGPFDLSSYGRDGPIVVCAVIENGGHGGTAAAPAALKVFERWFGDEGRALQGVVATRLMLDVLHHPLRPAPGHPTSSPSSGGSTGCSSRAVARSSPTGSGRSPGSPATTSRGTRATTSSARRSRSASASSRWSSRSSSTPTAIDGRSA